MMFFWGPLHREVLFLIVFLIYLSKFIIEAFFFTASMRLAVSKEEKWKKVIKLPEINLFYTKG